jgi:hypothetical protein
VPVVHTYNSSYSGGRDQEDCHSKPDQASSLREPILKKPITKKVGGVVQGVGTEFITPYHKKKKKRKENEC